MAKFLEDILVEGKFIKSGGDDTRMLLDAGGTKLVSDLLPRDGSLPMTGTLQIGNSDVSKYIKITAYDLGDNVATDLFGNSFWNTYSFKSGWQGGTEFAQLKGGYDSSYFVLRRRDATGTIIENTRIGSDYSTFNGDITVQGLSNQAGIYSSEGSRYKVLLPKGGSYSSGNNQAGAIQIKCPHLSTQTNKVYLIVDVYSLSGESSFTVLINGRTAAGSWLYTSARIVGNKEAQDKTIRFGVDSTTGNIPYIWIGEVGDTLHYASVDLRYVESDNSAGRENWEITQVAAFETVQKTESSNLLYADWSKLKGKTATASQLVLGDGSGKNTSDFVPSDTTDYLKRDGSLPMTGLLKLDNDFRMASDFPVSTVEDTGASQTGIVNIFKNSTKEWRLNLKYQGTGGDDLIFLDKTRGFTSLTLSGATGDATFGGKIIKSGSSDSYMLLGGGGTKLLSDFATSGHGHGTDYVQQGYFVFSSFAVGTVGYIGTVDVGGNGTSGGFKYKIVTQGGEGGEGIIQVSSYNGTATAYLKVIGACTDNHQILAKRRTDASMIDFYINPKRTTYYTPRVYTEGFGGYTSNTAPTTPTTWDYTWETNILVAPNKAETSTTISAGTGLSGGGDLSTDRTLSFDTTWGDARYLTSLPSHNHDGYYHLKSNAGQTDPNLVKVQSSYRFEPHSNNPTNLHYAGITYGNASNVTGQMLTNYISGESYLRAFNTSWTAWRKIWDDKNLNPVTIDTAQTITGAKTFSQNITAPDFVGSSDIRLKENIETYTPKEIVGKYKTYNFKSDEKKQLRVGRIAQELEKTNPEFVRTDDEGMKSISYSDLHSAEIAYLKAKVEQLESMINKLIK